MEVKTATGFTEYERIIAIKNINKLTKLQFAKNHLKEGHLHAYPNDKMLAIHIPPPFPAWQTMQPQLTSEPCWRHHT